MTTGRAHVIRLLQYSQSEFLDLVSGFTEEQWTYKPAPDCSSAAETAEHIVLAAAALFSGMREALANPPDPAAQARTAGKTEFLEQVMPRRARKVRSLERLRPQLKWTRQDAEVHRRDRPASERPHGRAPVSCLRHAKHLSVGIIDGSCLLPLLCCYKEPMPSWPCVAATSTADLRTIGRRDGRPNLHFCVAHPPRFRIFPWCR